MTPAAGIIIRARNTGNILLLKRSETGDASGLWAFPGGHIERGETASDAASRECLEETGYRIGSPGKVLLRQTRDEVDYTTFLKEVDEEFTPALNSEHVAHAWVRPEDILKESLPVPPLPSSAAEGVVRG